MKLKLLGLFALVLMLSNTSAAKKVHTLGDSTMAPYDESATVTRGWGMYFGQFLTNGSSARAKLAIDGYYKLFTQFHILSLMISDFLFSVTKRLIG